MLVKTILLLWTFAAPTYGAFEFTAKKWEFKPGTPIYVLFSHEGETLYVSCQTNDPSATVRLFKDGVDISLQLEQSKQIFTIKSLNVNKHHGQYLCKATDKNGKEIELKLGNLVVANTPVAYVPEIYPAKRPILIESNGDKDVLCKANGAEGEKLSYLTWYKKDTSGKLVLVDTSMIRRTETRTSFAIDEETIMFRNFQPDQAGTYTCVREVPGSPTGTRRETDVKIELSPDVSPKVTILESETKLYIDKVKQLSCESSGSPKPTLKWYHNGKVRRECKPSSEKAQCHILIENVKPEASDGNYTCEAVNGVGNDSKTVAVVVLVAPVVKQTPKLYLAGYTDEPEVFCEVTSGNPPPVVSWEKQPDTCANTQCEPLDHLWTNYTGEQFPDKETPTKFSHLKRGESESNNFFRCTATNMVSKATHDFKLVRTAETVVRFSMIPSEEPYTINEGDELVLTCETNANIYKSSQIKHGNVVVTTEAPSINVQQTRSINYKVDAVTLGDTGVYTCFADMLRTGETQNTSRTVVIKKLEASAIRNFNDITLSQDMQKDYVLKANVSGNPPPGLTWTFKGDQLDGTTLTSIDDCEHAKSGIYFVSGKRHQLLFCGLDYKIHQGELTLKAKNKVDETSKTINITITAKPEIVGLPGHKTFAISDTDSLDCVTSANPPANVTWLRTLKDKNVTLVTQIGSGKHLLVDVTKDHGGMYVCTATNEFGMVSQAIRVDVAGAGGIKGFFENPSMIAVVVVAILILLLALVGILLYRRHLKQRYALYLEPNKDFVIDPDRSLFDQSSDLPYDMAWEFPREKIKFLRTLGSGAFGQVWLAEAEGINNFHPRDRSQAALKYRKQLHRQTRRYHSFSVRYKKQHDVVKVEEEKTMVAVKTLKEDASEVEYKDLASELKILIHLGEHKNIVNLLGACTSKGDKLNVILECCPGGNLLNFLRSRRDIFKPVWSKMETDMENEFTLIDLVLISYQVSKGMDFLQSRKCIHRDLAARNILVGQDYVMKVADFGLARDIYQNELYLKEGSGLLPVKWMAPESLFDKLYTSSSDVWAYGILLWEVFTLGGSPYPGLPMEELYTFLEEDKRMDCPEVCPRDIYDIMLDCWCKSPYERPLFAQISERLSNVMKRHVSSASDYMRFDENESTDGYLAPSEVPSSKDEPNGDYLVAQCLSPKGHTYVPEPRAASYVDEDDARATDPLLLPPDDYEPMTPADHYQAPTPPSPFPYAKEAHV